LPRSSCSGQSWPLPPIVETFLTDLPVSGHDADQERVDVEKNRPDRPPIRAHESQVTDVGNDKIDENLHVIIERAIADEPGRAQEEDRSTAATGSRDLSTSGRLANVRWTSLTCVSHLVRCVDYRSTT
jgi:hypothetical protein